MFQILLYREEKNGFYIDFISLLAVVNSNLSKNNI